MEQNFTLFLRYICRRVVRLNSLGLSLGLGAGKYFKLSN